MKNIKFGMFVLGLALAVGGAVSVAAQDRSELRRPNVMVLDARGAQLGVSVSDVDVKGTAGVRIDDVDPDSPADAAGLREGDVVVEFDGERVRSARQFRRLVQETPEGRAVKMSVLRNGQRQTLEAIPENQATTWRFDRDPGSRFPTTRGRLGVTIQSLTPELEEYFGAKNGGVLVSSVAQDSAAAKAGMKAGDVITSINGRSVTGSGDLMRELRNLTGEVTLGIVRDKQAMTLKAVLKSGSAIL